MKLYRYELFCDEHPQDVGFIVGLNDIDISESERRDLIRPFDEDLEIPDVASGKAICLFTEYGNARFQDAIYDVIEAYDDSIFDVKKCVLDLSEDDVENIFYQDDDQICLSYCFFENHPKTYTEICREEM